MEDQTGAVVRHIVKGRVILVDELEKVATIFDLLDLHFGSYIS
jgi:hypothetical protein